MSRNPGMHTVGQCGFENIIAGDFRRITEGIVLQGGMKYPAGSVLGRIAATGICYLVDSSKSDGSENLYGILADEVDATSGDMAAIAYLTGEFNRHRMVFGGTDTAETHKDAARAKSIFFKDADRTPDL